MGLIYDVYYPGRADFDPRVPWSYLERLAAEPVNEGATAHCVNGPADVWTLRSGCWVQEQPPATQPTGTGAAADASWSLPQRRKR